MRKRGDEPKEVTARPPVRDGHAMRNALLLSVFVLLWLADLYFDVRHRDGFTWMDPEQYFSFARGLVDGSVDPRGFGVASIFPFFVCPFLLISASIPMAFCVNAAGMIALVAAIALLRREAGLSTPTVAIAALTLSSPLLTGLSRELYVEFFLTALAAFSLWLALLLIRRFTWKSASAFGAVFAVGFLTKMTFPLFAAVPLAGAVVARLLGGRVKESVRLLAVVIVPFAVAFAIAWFAFPAGREYYRTLGNTTIPVMHLIGPGKLHPVGAFFYYFVELFRNQFWLLSPLLILSVVALWPRASGWSLKSLDGRKPALWISFIVPLLLLGFSAVREPRHVAPVTVPAVLLIVMAVEAIPAVVARRAILAAACVIAGIQYASVTVWHRATPYFVDAPFHHQEIYSALPARADESLSVGLPEPMRVLQWKFNRNLAITGFAPNEALAFGWQTFPGVVYDLATVSDQPAPRDGVPFQSFEDLFLLTVFNTYNRRCGQSAFYATLPRSEVLDNAEFIIAKVDPRDPGEPAFEGHKLIKTLDFAEAKFLIFQSELPTEPYRALYANRYLEIHRDVSGAERSAIAYNLMTVDVLRGDFDAAGKLVRRFPVVSEQPRNIYWIPGYQPLLMRAQVLFRQYRSSSAH